MADVDRATRHILARGGVALLAALAVLLAACGSSSSSEGASSDGAAREDVASESSSSTTSAPSLTGAEAACDSFTAPGSTAKAIDGFKNQTVTDAQDQTYENSTVRRIYNCADHAIQDLKLTEEEGWLDFEYVQCGPNSGCAPRVLGYWKDGQTADRTNTASVTESIGTPTCCDEGQRFDWFGHEASNQSGIEGSFRAQIADGEGTTYTISGAWRNRPHRDQMEACNVSLKDDKYQVFACELVQTDGDNNTVQYLIYQTDT